MPIPYTHDTIGYLQNIKITQSEIEIIFDLIIGCVQGRLGSRFDIRVKIWCYC